MYCEYDPQKLLAACRQHTTIYCYGAGAYGRATLSFLRGNNVNVKAFLTTNDERVGLEGIPIRKFAKVALDELTDSLIILSLGAVHHKEVKNIIFSKCPNVDIFPIDSVLIDIFATAVNKNILLQNIMDSSGDSSQYNEQYEEQFHLLQERYSKIILCNVNLITIGLITTSWIYYNEIVHPEDEYWALYPCPNAKINDYLIGKLKSKNLEVVCRDSVKFWKYVVLHYRENVEIKTLPNMYEFLHRENELFSNHIIPAGKKYISFTQDEMNDGMKFLGEHNLDAFVCLFARDSKYLAMGRNAYDTPVPASTGPSLMDIYRNLSIDHFSLTAQYLRQNNITAVRMGHLLGSPAEDKNIFDYGYNHRSEFLDIFIFSQCKFFIGTPSGIQFIANLFSKPMVMVNVPVLSTLNDATFINSHCNLMILQKYLDTRDNHYLTIREMLKYETSEGIVDAHNAPFRTFDIYKRNNIVPIKNTAEEIASVAKEMVEIMDESVNYDDLDVLLQQQYESILHEFDDSKNYIFPYRMGRDFLRKNQWLLS